MALLRCPQCQLPVTEQEASSGACPACQAPFEVAAAAAQRPPNVPPPPSAPSLWWALGGGITLCVIVAAIWLLTRSDGDPAKEKQAKAPPAPTTTVQPPVTRKPEEKGKLEEKKTAQTDAKQDDDPANDKKDTEAKQDPKTENKNPKGDAEKKKQPDPVAVKKADPKKEDPKVIAKQGGEPKDKPVKDKPALQRPGFAVLPLLADGAIKIDGDLADWKDIAFVMLNPLTRGKSAKPVAVMPEAQKAYLAYTSKGLLIAVDIVDTSGAIENVGKPAKITSWPFWNNDAIEVFIDTLNQRPRGRGAPNLHQFFAFPFGTPGDNGVGGYESKILRAWNILPVEAIQKAGKKTAAGWTMEMLVPGAAIGQSALQPGTIFGFELQIDTGTNIFYVWACTDPKAQVSTQPYRWGEALLAGADARIELLDSARKPAKAYVPGQPLSLAIGDADMNRDPLKKEKITATVRSKAGDLKVTLEETEANSGSFSGIVATRLASGAPPINAVDVADDEAIVIEYVDRLRADGKRDQVVGIVFPPGPKTP